MPRSANAFDSAASELFAPNIDDQIACVEREIALRSRVYPRWIADKRLTQVKADREMACMNAVLETLRHEKERERK